MPEKINSNVNALGGSNLLDLNTTPLTDAQPTYSQITLCAHVNDLTVDLIADKGCTIVVTPILDIDDDTTLGLASDTGTLADGGGKAGVFYPSLGAPKVKIVVTKTEAGDCASTIISARGLA